MTLWREMAARLAEAARNARQPLRRAIAVRAAESPWARWLAAWAAVAADESPLDALSDQLVQTAASVWAAARLHSLPAVTPGDFPPLLQELLAALHGLPEFRSLLDQASVAAPLAQSLAGADRGAALEFYEAFQDTYDGRQRRRHGVFYTPQPVVSFIVRSLDVLLRDEFGLNDGLADTATWEQLQTRFPGLALPDGVRPQDPFVQIVDPATGPGTFLIEVVDRIHQTMTARWHAAGHHAPDIERLWNDYVPRHLLPRLTGFELMLGPYAIAHFELRAKLAATGYHWTAADRLRVYFANALAEPAPGARGPLPEALAQEFLAADALKRGGGTTVVLGNPPYAGASRNTGAWITRLVDDYRVVGGECLRERNPSWLLDDYVKFLRLGQHLIDRSGSGLLGMVTNDGFVGNPTFRGMRESLARSFTSVAILDLHGDANKRAVSPAGGRDENVFSIRQGVCIALMRKRPGPRAVVHAERWGPRAEKLAFLAAHDVSTCRWTMADCAPPYRLFRPLDGERAAEYARFRSIHDLFAVKGWGLKTRKDYLVVDFDRTALVEKFNTIAAMSPDEAIRTFGIKPSPYWDFVAAHRQMPADSAPLVRPVLFRPFDVRHVYYEKWMIERGDHKFDLMREMFAGNVALVTVRRNESNRPFDHVFCTRHMAVLHAVSAKEANFFYPAWTYGTDGCARPNLSSTGHDVVLNHRTQHCLRASSGIPTPGLVAPVEFHYLYAVLNSPAYRARYGEMLRVEFPRVPWNVDRPLFEALAALGADLVALHLLEPGYPAASWNHPSDAGTTGRSLCAASGPQFVAGAAPTVARGFPKYESAATGRVRINPACWFEGVAPAAWEFRIGGYRVLHNWLKDRRGRELSAADVTHFRLVVAAIEASLLLAARIDEVVAAHGDWPSLSRNLRR